MSTNSSRSPLAGALKEPRRSGSRFQMATVHCTQTGSQRGVKNQTCTRPSERCRGQSAPRTGLRICHSAAPTCVSSAVQCTSFKMEVPVWCRTAIVFSKPRSWPVPLQLERVASSRVQMFSNYAFWCRRTGWWIRTLCSPNDEHVAAEVTAAEVYSSLALRSLASNRNLWLYCV